MLKKSASTEKVEVQAKAQMRTSDLRSTLLDRSLSGWSGYQVSRDKDICLSPQMRGYLVCGDYLPILGGDNRRGHIGASATPRGA